ICRNAVLVITFDKNVSSSTILPSQLELLRGGCAGAALPPSKWKQRLAKWLLFISPVDAETWCDRRLGRIQASGNTITFIPDSPLKADRQHRVVISSPNVDCANSNGLCQWQFRTGADICQIDLVMVYPPNRLFTAAGQTQELLAQARSAEGQPLAADYSWEEDDSADVVAVTSPLNNQIINVTANNRSGEASMITTANGSNYGNSGEKSASATLTVFLCEVPWTTSDTDYDFRLMYCRGQTGSPDLLPELLVSGNDRNPATNNGLMREYFFKHPTLDEAIGLRIYRNSDHLSPQAWYATRGDITLGAPSPFTVDGYQAVRDAQTAYVGAVAKLSSNLYTNMYVLSFSQGASAETVSIFNQLVNQWLFNSDLMSQEQAKLQHDLIRLQDLAGLASKLSTYAAAHGGRYPKLPAGTFLVGQSTSVWSSWQAELGNELGQALPVDPTNTFNDCPSGYDPTTCWRASTKSFVCPAGSHVYQYKVASNSYGYTLYTNPEFKNVTWQGTTPVTITSNDACDSYTVTKVGNPLLSAEDAQ
ncbi:MAG: hypothetical protein U1C53_02065, partial [Candidatus Veblenbacteria bacterium]|nr:hypothetical protein [Candidatus Veblenbacteria bacterium]